MDTTLVGTVNQVSTQYNREGWNRLYDFFYFLFFYRLYEVFIEKYVNQMIKPLCAQW